METTAGLLPPLTPTQRFWRLLKPDRKDIRHIYIYSIFNGLINLSLPIGIQAIVNLIQGGRISTSWILLVIFVVLGIAFTGLLQIYQFRITETLQQKIFTRAAFEFAYRMPRVKLEVLYRHYAPELMNRFFDTLSVQKGLSKILIDFSSASFTVVFGLLLLSFYHPFFILFSLVLLMLVFAIFQYTIKRGLATSLAESKYKYRVAHWLEELARTLNTFKLAGKTDLALQRTNTHVSDYLRARESHFRILVQQLSLTVVFKVLVATGLLAIGGLLVMEQQMNIGQFVAAEIIILLVMASVEKLIQSMETIYDVLTALEKIGQVTDMELEKSAGIDLMEQSKDPGLTVEMANAGFSYPDHEEKTLKNISLSLPAGDRLVITGANGSGKSSLLYILAGLYDLQEGYITYNGLPKGNLDLHSLRSAIGDCLTQEQIFEGTVFENISMGRPTATFARVKLVCENLGLGSFIRALPQGYDTVLDPEGKKLPKSTVQKILLARSIADKPRLLLLKDAFEYIDEKERQKIIDFLTDPVHGWTMVAVSSDPYLMERCDRVAVMIDGRITEIRTIQKTAKDA